MNSSSLITATSSSTTRRTSLKATSDEQPQPPKATAAQLFHDLHFSTLIDQHYWAPIDTPRAMRALSGSRDQLDLEVELITVLDDALHPEPVQADEAANVILHPLLLLTP
jgi:hypothetical protein